MKRELLIFIFFIIVNIASSQQLTCDTTLPPKKKIWGIGCGVRIHSYTQYPPINGLHGKAEMFGNPAPYPEHEMRNKYYYNIFYERFPLSSFLELNFTNRDHLIHNFGCSFYRVKNKWLLSPFKYIHYPASVLDYSGLYLYYKNQLMFNRFIKIFIIRNLYIGGIFQVVYKNIYEKFSQIESVANVDYRPFFNETNISSSLLTTCGFRTLNRIINFDIGINWNLLSLGMGKHWLDVYDINLISSIPEKRIEGNYFKIFYWKTAGSFFPATNIKLFYNF